MTRCDIQESMDSPLMDFYFVDIVCRNTEKYIDNMM